jgi:hypothetical protein
MRQFGKGGQKVPEGRYMVALRPPLYGTRPTCNHRHPNTPFIEISFDPSKWPIAVVKVRIITSFTVWAVITRENDQRFFVNPQ